MRRPVALLALLLVTASGCEDRPSAPAPAASAPGSAAPVAATAKLGGAAPALSAGPSKPVVQILRMTLTSEVKSKEPVDELTVAEPGQRVWAHLAVRNRTGGSRRLTLRFLVDGDERSSVDLTVDTSWSYRTWGYNTLRAADKGGELSVEVRDEDGGLLQKARLPIKVGAKKSAPADHRGAR